MMHGLPASQHKNMVRAALELAEQRDAHGVARCVFDTLRGLPGALAAGAAAAEQDRETYERITFSVADPAEPAIHVLRGGESELALLRAGELYSADLGESCPAPLAPLRALGVRRFIATPLLHHQQTIGTLFAGFESGDEPRPQARAVVEALARLAEPVLWNLLIDARLSRGDRRREVLVAFGAAINASLEFDAVISAARRAIDNLADDAGCSIDLIEPDGRRYRVYRAGGPLQPRLRPEADPPVLPLEGSPLHWVAEHRETCTSDDLERAARFPIDALLRQAGIRRYVVAPMIVRGSVIGALFIGSVSPNPPLHMDVWLYENIALQTGLAIDNARQFRRLQEFSERLALQNVYLQEEIRLEHDLGEMIGRSAAIQQVRQAVSRVARTDATVLIHGETGVGKELVARAIHEASARAAQPMVKVNCAAIPEGMVESELFGHERGAFTSAVQRRIGRFELSHDGTLLLDEIGELSPAVQSKLLRVLQDGEFERVGGARTLHSNARIIAATNRDLERMAESGQFRRDLFYRLNVFPIFVPPLRERLEDIPLLVENFVAQLNRRMGKHVSGVAPAALRRLQQRDWPGNIRELRHAIERAMVLCDGPLLTIDERELPRAPAAARAVAEAAGPAPHVGPAPRSDRASLVGAAHTDPDARAGHSARARPPPDILDFVPALREIECEHIRRALEACGGRIDGANGAAALLQIHPSTLRSRMKKLNIRRPG